MKRLLLLFIITLSQLNAITLDEVVEKALEKNYSLESIKHKISVANSDVDISNQFENPSINLLSNTIDKNEKMSQQTLTLKQKVPYWGKRDSKKSIAIAKEQIQNEKLAQAKVNLAREIKEQAYTVWELEELYKIILDYEDLTRQNIDLSESYTSIASNNQHMGIVSAELTLSSLLIQKNVLKAKIYKIYSKLSYLASFRVSKLDLDLKIDTFEKIESLRGGLVNNNSIVLINKKIKEDIANLNLAKKNNYPDIKILASYSYRENFDDFMVFGLGVTLPIYSTEDYKEEKAMKVVLSSESLKADTLSVVDSMFESIYVQMKSDYEIYHIIHDQSLPQIEHMFELTNSMISTGSDLFKYIDILGQKLNLEQQSIKAIARYNRSKAQMTALRGEIK